jgi:hypothetical protein
MKILGWIILAFLFLPVLTRKTAGATAAVGTPGGASLVTLPSNLLSSFFGGTATPTAANDPVGIAIKATATDGTNTTAFGPPSPAPGDIMQANTDLAKIAATTDTNTATGAGMPTVDSGGDTTNLGIVPFL